MIGKRKRDVAVVRRQARDEEEENSDRQSPSSSPVNDDVHDIMRKAFEARFGPVDEIVKPVFASQNKLGNPLSSEEEGEDDEFEGLSDEDDDSDGDGDDDDDDNQSAEVVEHTISWKSGKDEIDRQARKAFMNAKPPSSTDFSKKLKPTTKSTSNDSSEPTDAENLKNDLALQRLLKESHLLESADDLNPTGAKRHRAIDLRMQSAGATSSLFTQEKMPMSHRKGISSKASKREETRRREAKENGIILEKPAAKKKKGGAERRERGIGGPSVGKFAGGTLRLSKKDVSEIQGSRGRGMKGGRGKGRGRGGRK
ncbi:hypothetical protein AJ79_02155 [Helicocarpus griseus UAMH5409]|uniref:Protein FAF1 n=1 Tax=Helicocarpus griseus UAMH5409 TaxID=1447875 RepID=A0A2B7Y3J2_9EURO|nr:hypothetical protein AJ79_02155 [Helicocarpus griseus UAMH5409]